MKNGCDYLGERSCQLYRQEFETGGNSYETRRTGQGRTSGEKPELLQVNPKEFISWKDGIYFFNKESLEEMMKTVGRNYDVEVFFNGEALKKLRFSGQLKKYERVEEFLQFIETGGDVTFIVKDRTITVNPK